MTHHDTLIGLVLIIILGVGAQWLAWRVRLPSILLLLAFGILAGPISALFMPEGRQILDTRLLIDDGLLLPLISISVGLILYEGGLTLRFRDIAANKQVVWKLISLGALVTWVTSAFAAVIFMGISPTVAIMLGAILTVTGPTVIGPLLNHIRPVGASGPILRWEGIAIDPVGALLAVLVFEVILAGQQADGMGYAVWAIVKSVAITIVVGGGLGVAAAWLLVQLLRRYWVPEQLQNPVSLLLVIVVFVLSDLAQKESGLLATTVMGIVLANQRRVDVHHILEFKENLRVLLISVLFIVLGSRLDLAGFQAVGWGVIPFLVVLIVLVRPLSVWASTAGSKLDFKQRAFLMALAPRGIVAAAVASVFGLSMEEAQVPDAELLSPIIFSVIIVTVAFYGFAAGPFARRMGIADANPQGVAFVGAFPWVRELALAIHKRGYRVLLIDANYQNIQAARMVGVPVWYGNALGDHAMDEIDLTGIGRMIAATPNEEINALVTQRFARRLGKAGVFQLAPSPESLKRKGLATDLLARKIGSGSPTFDDLNGYHERGGIVKVTTLSDEFTFHQFRMLYGSGAKVMFVLGDKGKLSVMTPESPDPLPGQTLITLVNPDELFIL